MFKPAPLGITRPLYADVDLPPITQGPFPAFLLITYYYMKFRKIFTFFIFWEHLSSWGIITAVRLRFLRHDLTN